MAKERFEFSKLNRGRFKRFTSAQLDTVNIDADGLVSINYESSETQRRIINICKKYVAITNLEEHKCIQPVK
jgi:hypothetical protein